MITSSLIGRTLLLTFEDPKSRNAFSVRAARELASALAGSFDSLVFTARGRVFCSGGNLSDYASLSADEGRAINQEIRSVLATLAALPVPCAAAVCGDAFGGGVELLSCFDHVVSVPHAFFGLWQRRIGLTYGWGGGPRLEARLGAARARSLALEASSFDARAALSYGLVDALSSQPVSAALEWVSRKLPLEPVADFKNGGDFDKLWWNDSHRAVLANRTKS